MEAGVGKVLELVVYKLKEGASQAAFLATNGAVSNWISTQPGFISRDLVYDGEGDRWVDVVWWDTIEGATAAAEAAMSSEACTPMFALIDMESALMLHGRQAIATVGSLPAVAV